MKSPAAIAERSSPNPGAGGSSGRKEVGLVVGDEYFAIRDFREGANMKMRLDMDKIARGLGARRRGKAAASGGYFGAMQLLADI